MKTRSILLMALAAGVLGAQDAPDVDKRVQVFLQYSSPNSITVGLPPDDVSNSPKSLTGVGLRIMGEFPPWPGWYFELGGQLDTSSKFSYNGVLPDGNTLDLSDAKFSEYYVSFAVAYLYRPNPQLSLGAHLEGRAEHLTMKGSANWTPNGYGQMDHSVSFLRPWLRGSADYTFTQFGESLHPFVGVEAGFAFTKTSQTVTANFTEMDDRTLKSLAPRYAFGVYAGIRF